MAISPRTSGHTTSLMPPLCSCVVSCSIFGTPVAHSSDLNQSLRRSQKRTRKIKIKGMMATHRLIIRFPILRNMMFSLPRSRSHMVVVDNMCAASSLGTANVNARCNSGMVHYTLVVLLIAFEMFLSRTMYISNVGYTRAFCANSRALHPSVNLPC
jgi:hypothetical protein